MTVDEKPSVNGFNKELYWAPEWIRGGAWESPDWSPTWENRALFDPDGEMLPGLRAFERTV